MMARDVAAGQQNLFSWGLDLAGLNGQVNSLECAGGIGGLVAVYDTLGTSGTSDDVNGAFFYNANGDVGQVLNLTKTTLAAATVAKYEYDPYGRVTAESGSYAARNSWRFSTKQFDAVTGLGYWGYRYYSAKLGRWVSRDPMLEPGFSITRNNWRLSAGLTVAAALDEALYRYADNEVARSGVYDALGLCRPQATRTNAVTESCGFCRFYTKSCNQCQVCQRVLKAGLCFYRWNTVSEACSDCGTGLPAPPCTFPPPAPPGAEGAGGARVRLILRGQSQHHELHGLLHAPVCTEEGVTGKESRTQRLLLDLPFALRSEVASCALLPADR